MTLRYYSSIAQDTTLTTQALAVSTTLSVGSTVGWPLSYPFTLALEYNSSLEELVDVSGVAGLLVTCTRGVDSTIAITHAAGATVRHVITARDIREANTHVNASSAVHGLAGSVVGTTDTQTLTNKDLTDSTNKINWPVVAGKNAIINGGMDIWQRGTSVAIAASGNSYLADRWQSYTGVSQAVTISRQATADTTNLPNIAYCMRYQRNAAQTGTGGIALATTFETANSIQFAGKAVTISFYARAGANYSATSSVLGAFLNYGTGTDQNYFTGFTGATTVMTNNATLTTTWQRFSYTGTVPATATQLVAFFYYSPTGTAGANDYFEVTGVQLELGSTATTFSRAGGSINGEETAVGSAAQDGILYSQNASSNPSGSGSNAWAGYSPAGKNAIINGGMDIWQRGTSIAQAANLVGYTADRMYLTTQLNSASVVSRQATSDSTNLPNIQYCLRVQRNAGQTGTGNIISQSIETINSIPFAGKQVTLSFYARAGANYSPTANVLSVVLYSGTGTDQNINGGFTGQATPIATTATLTTTWQRFSFTGTIASTATQLAPYFNAASTGTAGANDYFEITGVQLELGSTATTFSRAGGSIGGELALCQRYLPAITGGEIMGFSTSTTQAFFTMKLPVTARVAPTGIIITSLGTVFNGVYSPGAANSLTFNIAGVDYASIYSASTAGTPTLTAGQGASLRSMNLYFTGCEL